MYLLGTWLPLSLFTHYNRPMSPLALVTGAAQRLGKVFALDSSRDRDLTSSSITTNHPMRRFRPRRSWNLLEAVCSSHRLILTEPAQIQSLVSKLNSLQVLVNSAAFMPSGNVNALTIENWDTALDLNLRAPFLLAQECSKKMTAVD